MSALSRIVGQSEIADDLLTRLDKIARDEQPHEYGLPMNNEPVKAQMREAIYRWINEQERIVSNPRDYNRDGLHINQARPGGGPALAAWLAEKDRWTENAEAKPECRPDFIRDDGWSLYHWNGLSNKWVLCRPDASKVGVNDSLTVDEPDKAKEWADLAISILGGKMPRFAPTRS